VKLAGSRANRDGVGARIKVTAGSRWQTALVKTGASYCSQSELVATFGLDQATQADRVEVTWPGGAVQTIESVPSRTLLVVHEDGSSERLAGR
jgi:enediyne biosynthesis protein E4